MLLNVVWRRFVFLFPQGVVQIHRMCSPWTLGEPYSELHTKHERPVAIMVIANPELRRRRIWGNSGGIWTCANLAPNAGLTKLPGDVLNLVFVG